MVVLALFFLAGIIFGGLSCRALGWLVVCIGLSANTCHGTYGYVTLHNGSANGVWWTIGENSEYASMLTAGQTDHHFINSLGAGTYNVRQYCNYDHSDPQIVGTITVETSDAGTEYGTFELGCPYTPPGPYTTNYVFLCVTNQSNFPRWYKGTVKWNSGPGADYVTYSGALPGSGVWCFDFSHAGIIYADISELTPGLDYTTNTPPIVFWTNTPPGPMPGPGPHPPGWMPTNAPSPPGPPWMGGGSTNGLTGDQFAKGINQLDADMKDGLKAILNEMERGSGTNGQPPWNISFTNTPDPWTHGILTNVQATEARLAAIASNGTYFDQVFANFDTSNTIWFQVMSNALVSQYSGADAFNSQFTNYDLVEPDDNFWSITVPAGLGRQAVVFDLDPRHWRLWWLTGWLKLIETIALCSYMYWWIHQRFNHLVETSFLIPGSSLMKIPAENMWLFVATRGFSVLVVGEFLMQIPNLLGGGFSAVFGGGGEWLTQAVFYALMGDTTVGGAVGGSGGGPTLVRCLLEGVTLLNELFPLPYALFCYAYTLIFDKTAMGVAMGLWLRLKTRCV